MADFEDEELADWEPSPEHIAEIKRGSQNCDMGHYYTMLADEDGKLTWDMECNMCKRVGNPFKDRPFPHKFDCPMKNRVKD